MMFCIRLQQMADYPPSPYLLRIEQVTGVAAHRMPLSNLNSR
jgi:hypothetical protein